MKAIRKLACALALSVAGGTASAQAYPEREVAGVIMWGAGGAADVAIRSVAVYAEEALGRKIVLQNKPGGTGVIASNFVLRQKPDGYTFLGGAENPALYKVMGLADFDYDDFHPINIMTRGVMLLVANKDTPWHSLKDLVADAQARPGKIRMYTSGAGGAPFTVSSMLSSVVDFPVNAVPFDGDGPGITAMLGGHVDFGIIAAGAALEHVKSGRLKALGVFDDQAYQGIPAMSDDVPELKKFMPWGSFFGIFTRKDVPDEARTTLEAAFRSAVDRPEYREIMERRGNVMLNLSGDEAAAYIKRWQSITAWAYQEAGVAKHSPEALGIARP